MGDDASLNGQQPSDEQDLPVFEVRARVSIDPRLRELAGDTRVRLLEVRCGRSSQWEGATGDAVAELEARARQQAACIYDVLDAAELLSEFSQTRAKVAGRHEWRSPEGYLDDMGHAWRAGALKIRSVGANLPLRPTDAEAEKWWTTGIVLCKDLDAWLTEDDAGYSFAEALGSAPTPPSSSTPELPQSWSLASILEWRRNNPGESPRDAADPPDADVAPRTYVSEPGPMLPEPQVLPAEPEQRLVHFDQQPAQFTVNEALRLTSTAWYPDLPAEDRRFVPTSVVRNHVARQQHAPTLWRLIAGGAIVPLSPIAGAPIPRPLEVPEEDRWKWLLKREGFRRLCDELLIRLEGLEADATTAGNALQALATRLHSHAGERDTGQTAPQRPQVRETAERDVVHRRALTTTEVATVFDGFAWASVDWLTTINKGVPDWLSDCRLASGKPGNQSVEATWDPLAIVEALARGRSRKFKPPGDLHRIFNHELMREHRAWWQVFREDNPVLFSGD